MKVCFFSFIHPKEQHSVHLQVGCSVLHIKGNISHTQISLALEMCFLQIQSQCMNPQGPNKAADLFFLLFFFLQINIFPKDLNLKQQLQLKSNTIQTFGSSTFTVCLCVLYAAVAGAITGCVLNSENIYSATLFICSFLCR